MTALLIQWITRSPLKPQQVKWHQMKQSQDGFTMLEVLVGVLLTVIFMLIAIQSIAVAAALRVKAQEGSDAVAWVGANRSEIVSMAKNLGGYDEASGTYMMDASDRQRCDAAETEWDQGFADLLRDQFSDAHKNNSNRVIEDDFSHLSPIGNREYTLRRRTNVSDSSPHVLTIQYDVYRGTDPSTDPIIYSYYTEILPGVTFACKQI